MKRAVLSMLEENYAFENNKGSLDFSCNAVEMIFDKAEQRKGTFQIKNIAETPMEGYILSDNMRMQCLTPIFRGDSAEITYCFDSTGMEPGDEVKGEFQIISNKGEYTLAYEVRREKHYLNSTMGNIRNLFHFANLAKTNWEEAVQLYYSRSFAEILEGNDAQYLSIYRGLSNKPGNQQNLDEFLVAVKKKSRIVYRANVQEIKLKDIEDTVMKEIEITKEGWGYVSMKISLEGYFVGIEKDTYTEDDFLGNRCRIPVYIEPDHMHQGINYGKVTVTTPQQVIEITIIAENHPISIEENAEYEWLQLTARITEAYIDFRLGKTDTEQWIAKTAPLVEKMSGSAERKIIANLYKAQLLLAQERIQDADYVLNGVEAWMSEEKQLPEVYGYFLYLTTLLNRDENYTDKVAHKVKKLFQREQDNFRLAWLMLYLQKNLFFHEDKKWDFLEERYYRGACSPILYTEALQLLWEQPSLLMKLEGYEISLLLFGMKHDALNEEIAERIQFLISREKEYDFRIYAILKYCYQKSPSREMVQAICAYLMKGNCIGKDYFEWYAKAVDLDLRLTRLYEYYIMSIDLNYKGELPQMVMMYFAYQNNLDYERMAFLYANVWEHRGIYPEIALSYTEHLEDFVREQIACGRINDNLLKLYKRILVPAVMDVKFANDASPMIFMHEVAVDDSRVKNVVVSHEHLRGEKIYPVENGKAYVPIYSIFYKLLFEDGYGNRYVPNEFMKLKPVLFNDELFKVIQPMTGEQTGVVLYYCEGGRNYIHISEENVYSYARLLHSEDITSDYYNELLVALIKYYFEQDYVRELDDLLLQADPKDLSAVERAELVHILVARGMYDMAFDWVCEFGAEHMDVKTILRLCSRLLVRRDFEEEEHMLGLCTYIYRRNRYDENILSYLVKYFEGGIRELRGLLRNSEGFAIDTYTLLERLLVQSLFAGVYIGEKMKLYEMYIQKNGNLDIEKAFLTRCAYDYFVEQCVTEDKVFERLAGFMAEGEKMSRVCRLAVLKAASEKEESSWNVELLRELLNKEIAKGNCFPFFTAFAGKIIEVLPFTDRTFVEYKGEPGSRVIIHYAIERDNGGETEYRKEEMRNLYGGIFVKSFILFTGETVQYYITEQSGNREQLTQSSMVSRSDSDKNTGDWRFSLLNQAVLKKEEKDYEGCQKAFTEYVKKDFMIREIFGSR